MELPPALISALVLLEALSILWQEERVTEYPHVIMLFRLEQPAHVNSVVTSTLNRRSNVFRFSFYCQSLNKLKPIFDYPVHRVTGISDFTVLSTP